jgi:hypothetical protein
MYKLFGKNLEYNKRTNSEAPPHNNIVANLLSNFKYGNLFEEMANSSKNNNITIGFKMSLG